MNPLSSMALKVIAAAVVVATLLWAYNSFIERQQKFMEMGE